MSTLRQAFLILAVAAVAAVASGLFHPARPAWYEVEDPSDLRWRVSLDRAREMVASGGVVWIDARARANYEEDHLPGAILLNAEEWAELMFSNQEALQAVLDRPVIVYCDGGGCKRDSEIAQRLRELLGLDPVYILDGPWRALKQRE